ncbi:hypothetical protein PoB_007199400 [Plakobranchus ocellatus]|uniref:Uncharacterized protein n=1 Tax=Plakobranchus ocellatus TaxID=259542 RepID=A0AAV4DMR8_9GAST|nr:hypothetical protein PoB_007199400 [Plakobranchus ocellatus]
MNDYGVISDESLRCLTRSIYSLGYTFNCSLKIVWKMRCKPICDYKREKRASAIISVLLLSYSDLLNSLICSSKDKKFRLTFLIPVIPETTQLVECGQQTKPQ